MKKNTTALSKKLASYSLLAGSMVAGAHLSHAQVVYTDAEDETFTENNTGFFMDLDNDGLTDFTIAIFNFTSNGKSFRKVVAIPTTGNSVAGPSLSGYNFPSDFNSGDQICEVEDWQVYTTSSQVFILASSNNDIGGGNEQHRGEFLGAIDEYLGLRFTNDGENHYYGWGRLDVAADAGSFTIKDFAYQMDPDTLCIEAGDTGSFTAIPQVLINNTINIVSFDRNVFISAASDEYGDMIITLVNLSGGIVQRVKTHEQQYHLQLNEVSPGIYLVNVLQGKMTKTKKISIH